MPINPYRNIRDKGAYTEADLYESIIVESIQWSGHNTYYIPRSVNKFDQLYGEDVLASFDLAIPIEMYLEDVTGYGGEGAMISKFGFELRESATFVVARKRFRESVATELAAIKTDVLSQRPNEGDLIYFPQTESFFEIKYVDSSSPFNQLQAKFIWKLNCELFRFNSEKFDTGVPEIDVINSGSINRLEIDLIDANGNPTTSIEEHVDTNIYSDNEVIKQEFLDIVDFSENNPFSTKF